MNDVSALEPGQCQWNGWLSAKGRLVALFQLLRLAPEQWLLILPDYPAPLLKEQLQRFVFRSQLQLQSVADRQVAAGQVPAGLGIGAWADGEDGAIALAWPDASGTRGLWLLPAGHPALAPGAAARDQAWLAADLAAGLPRLPEQGREAWTPHMLSLERFSAFSLRKGCYPGQEIVARTHYLGQSRRGLARLAGSGLAPGISIEADGVGVGTVACATADGGEALAVLARDAGDRLLAGGLPCRRLALAPES